MTTKERFEMNIDQVNSDFQGIKSKIVECGVEVADGTKTAELAEKVGEVFEAGKKSEYDAFWDTNQRNGERRGYYRAYPNTDGEWSAENFRPKYDFICEGSCAQMFYGWEYGNVKIDLGAIFKQQGIILDTSRATNVSSLFAFGAKLTGELPTVSCANAGSNTNGIFRGCKVSKIEKFIVTELTTFDTTFYICDELVDIVFEGTIANTLSMSQSTKLSKASIISVISHLSDTTTGLTVTLSKTAVDVAFEEDGGAVGSVSTEWENLVATKPNWTISLA